MAYNPLSLAPIRAINPSILADTEPDHRFLIDQVALDTPIGEDEVRGQIPRLSRRIQMGAPSLALRTADSAAAPMIGEVDPDFVNYDITEPLRARARTLYREVGNNQIKLLQVREGKARSAMNACRMQLEVDWAGALVNPANWNNVGTVNTSTLAALVGGSGAQIGAAGATEFTDLRVAADIAADTSGGAMPTGVMFGIAAWRALKNTIEFGTFGNTTTNRFNLPDDQLMDLVRQHVGVDEVHVHQVRRETAAPLAASVEAYIVNEQIVFYYREGPIGRNTSAHIRVSGPTGSDIQTVAQDNWTEGDGTRSWDDEVALFQGSVLVGQHGDAARISLGYLLTDTVP